MKTIHRMTLAVMALIACAGLAQAAPRDVLYQVSTLDALMAGRYDGLVTLKELRAKGDIGIGTFHGLDGEMILLDGVFYRAGTDGGVTRPPLSVRTPFAMVTFHDRDITAPLHAVGSLSELTRQLDALLPSLGLHYVIRVDGRFRTVKARSVPAQQAPYPPLTAVPQSQFTWSEIEGTLVGYRLPYFVTGANMAGYHFHFIDKARRRGGHVLQIDLLNGTAEIDITREYYLRIDPGAEFVPDGDAGMGYHQVEGQPR